MRMRMRMNAHLSFLNVHVNSYIKLRSLTIFCLSFSISPLYYNSANNQYVYIYKLLRRHSVL